MRGRLQRTTPAPFTGRNDLLTAKQVAARLRVCTATVYKLCASGTLRHIRVLNAVRVAPAELERFITGKPE